MAVTHVGLFETFQDEGTIRTGYKRFKVTVSDRLLDDAFVALNAGGIPTIGDSWSAGDEELVCNHIDSPQFDDSALMWYVKADYILDPVLWPIEFHYDFNRSRELISPLKKDVVTGKPVVNSAGQRFDPDVEDDVFDLLITVIENSSQFPVALAKSFINTINDADVAIENETYPEGTLKVVGFRGPVTYAGGIKYYTKTIELAFRADGWKINRLDDGRMELDPETDEPMNSLDPSGMPVAEPVLLDGEGHRVEPGGDAHYLAFNLNIQKDFLLLGFTSPP